MSIGSVSLGRATEAPSQGAVTAAFFVGAQQTDTRQDRIPAFFGPVGAAPSALTPAGKAWSVRWTTQLKIDVKDRYHFALRGNGTGSLRVDGVERLTGLNNDSEAVELPAGNHAVVIAFTPPEEGSAQLRWFWKSSAFGWEPVPATALVPAAGSPSTPHETLRDARNVLAENSCLACHQTKAPVAMPEATRFGPDLEHIGGRVTQEWMTRWIANPASIRPHTHMPTVFHGEDALQKAAHIARYLAGTMPALVPVDRKGDSKRGGHLYQALNCYSCHDMNAADNEERIPLVNIGDKWWPGALAEYLMDPAAHFPSTRMPDFGLSATEAADLEAFLRTRTTDQEKPALPKGDPVIGRRLLAESGCLNCHHAPRLTSTARFPDFDALFEAGSSKGCLAPEGSDKAPRFAEALDALRGFSSKQILDSLAQDNEAEFAQRQFAELNCMACHSLDGHDAVRTGLSEEVAHLVVAREGDHATGPENVPALDHFGHKLRADWLAELFGGKTPEKARPWLEARMPAWPSRAEALATGFAHSHGVSPLHTEVKPDAADRIAVGKELVGQTGFACVACHAVGDQKALAVFEGAGQNLALASQRLRPDFYHAWMHFPQRFQPTTIMPRYAIDGKSTLPKHYKGDAEQQFKAIYDYLQTISSHSTAGQKPGLIGEYYHLTEGLGDTYAIPTTAKPWLVRVDPQINFPNTTKGFYGAKLDNNFLVRWSGIIDVPKDGMYTLFLSSDDGSRLAIDGKEILNFWGPHSYGEEKGQAWLTAGQHEIELVYMEMGGGQGCVLAWQAPGGKKEIIPPTVFSHATARHEAIAWDPKPWQKARILAGPASRLAAGGKPIPAHLGSLIGAPYRINKDVRGDNVAFRAHAVKLDEAGKVGVVFDTDTLRLAATFVEGGIQFEGLPFSGGHGAFPNFKSAPLTATGSTPGWSGPDGVLADPRLSESNYYPPLGNLPQGWGDYRGAYRFGDKVIFEYVVGETRVLEHHALKVGGEQPVIARILEVAPHDTAHTVVLADGTPGAIQVDARTLQLGAARVQVLAAPEGSALVLAEGQARLTLPATKAAEQVEVLVWKGGEAPAALVEAKPHEGSLAAWCTGGPLRWPETVITQGTLAPADAEEAYVLDRIGLPMKNPYTQRMRVGAFDFFADGTTAAVCTWDGEVWLATGIDDGLERIEWKLFATGIHEPLGLRIVDDKIYTVSDDQITRFHDLNNDGEADYYENFNNDWQVTSGFHAFAFDLHTDPQGNFYFALGMPVKGGGRGFERIGEHNGTILRISKDGSTLSKYATGFRAPNGMGVSPTGQVTSGDNEGTFVPRSPLNWVKEGGFYGVVDAYDGRDRLTTTAIEKQIRGDRPEAHDDAETPKPLAWFPKSVDNSGGGQTWVTSNGWGPLAGSLLHASYGQSALYLVLKEEVNGQMQGGVVKFPIRPSSSIMRLRFNERDGQLYLTGLKGWQTNAGQAGGFDRIRYTGKPVDFPVGIEAKKTGLVVRFSTSLEAAAANDPQNYSLRGSDIRWSLNYGSQEYLLGQRDLAVGKKQKGWTTLKVSGARLLDDGKSVALAIDGMVPAHQMELNISVKTVEGRPIKTKVNHTVHELGE